MTSIRLDCKMGHLLYFSNYLLKPPFLLIVRDSVSPSLKDALFLKLSRNPGKLLSPKGAVLFQSSMWKELISPFKALIFITSTLCHY